MSEMVTVRTPKLWTCLPGKPHWICSFIYTFIHSFIHSFVHSFVHSFIPSSSFVRWFIDLFIHSFIHSFIHLFLRLFIRKFIYSVHYSATPTRCSLSMPATLWCRQSAWSACRQMQIKTQSIAMSKHLLSNSRRRVELRRRRSVNWIDDSTQLNELEQFSVTTYCFGTTAVRIGNWVTTADAHVHSADATQLNWIILNLFSLQISDRNQSAVVGNSVHNADGNTTWQLRRVGVAGVNWALDAKFRLWVVNGNIYCL